MTAILMEKLHQTQTPYLHKIKVVRLFDINDDGRIDYYEFISSLHPRDSYKPMNDADKIEDEVIREVAQCRCCDRFNIEQISDNKYRVSHHRMSLFRVIQ